MSELNTRQASRVILYGTADGKVKMGDTVVSVLETTAADGMAYATRFNLEYLQLLPSLKSDAVRRKSVRPANSETACRNFGASLDVLDIFHAVRGKSWHLGILRTKGTA